MLCGFFRVFRVFRVLLGLRVLGSLMGKEGPREPAVMPGRIIENTQRDRNYVSINICRILAWIRHKYGVCN
jgi:hypothetical protein